MIVPVLPPETAAASPKCAAMSVLEVLEPWGDESGMRRAGLSRQALVHACLQILCCCPA